VDHNGRLELKKRVIDWGQIKSIMDILVVLISLWLVVIGIILALRFLYQKLSTRRPRRRGATASRMGNVRRETQRTLMALLNGDRKTADRLLQQARFQHPGRSENWYWEKVAYDLKRDRRL
jgi:uncharacterized protein HemY